MESFEELSLPEFLIKNLKQINFMKPTPVQEQAIPPALEGKDVIASAQTGTGKTGAFGIAILSYLEKNKDKIAVIMTPTRELAVQVQDVLRQLSGNHPLGGSVLLIGGANMQAQFMGLKRKPRLIIGTPGRIIDHLTRGSLILSTAGFLVLDEADRMLDMGFAPQLEEIRKRLPAIRQTLLFSATFPLDIQRMANSYLKNPVRITIGATTKPVEKINQEVVFTTESRKFDQLMLEIQERQGSILIFARTQVRVDRINDRLKIAGLKVTRIHGGRTQSQRRQAIDQFREGRFLILVATDIAARGLDIHHIAHVINYDLPKNPEDYIHRIGRTARAGAEGNSICLLTPEDRSLWERILKLLGTAKASVKIKKSSHPGFTPPRIAPTGRVNSFKPEGSSLELGDREKHSLREHVGQRQEPRGGNIRREGSDFNRAPQRDSYPRDSHRHDKSEFKQRHPDGRHQRRSEEHQQRFMKDPEGGSAGFKAPNYPKSPANFGNPSRQPHREPGGSTPRMDTPWGPMGSRTFGNSPSERFRRDRGGSFNPPRDRGSRNSFGDRSFRKEGAPPQRFKDGEIDGNQESHNKSRNAFGDSKFFGHRKNFGERRDFNARKPFGSAQKPFGHSRPFNGERKPFSRNKPFGGSDRRGPFDRPSFGEKKFAGNRSFADGKPSGDRPSFQARKPFRENRSTGHRPSFGDRKPLGGGNRPMGGRKPFHSLNEGGHSKHSDPSPEPKQ